MFGIHLRFSRRQLDMRCLDPARPPSQHILIYAGLALIIYRAVNCSKNNSNFLVVFSTTLYGITDEIHQHFVPGRTFEFLDIGMDFLGAILAIIIIYAYKKLK